MFEYIQKQRVINPPKFGSQNTEIWARALDDEASVKVWSKTFEEYRRSCTKVCIALLKKNNNKTLAICTRKLDDKALHTIHTLHEYSLKFI